MIALEDQIQVLLERHQPSTAEWAGPPHCVECGAEGEIESHQAELIATLLEPKLSVLRKILALHPTQWMHVGSVTHGGPEQFNYGCQRHGFGCSEWAFLHPKQAAQIAVNGLAVEPTHLYAKRLIDEAEFA